MSLVGLYPATLLDGTWSSSGIAGLTRRTLYEVHQVLSITIPEQRLCQALELCHIDIPHAIGGLLNAGDLEPLPTLKSFDKICGLEQGFMSPHIQPRHAPPQQFYAQGALRQIGFIDIGNLELPTGRGCELGGNIHDLIIVKIQANHRVIGSGIRRLFFEANDLPPRIKLHHPIAFWLLHPVPEDSSTGPAACTVLQDVR